ncbi:hypothetical protein PENTCL1PPCAC_10538, partial [Pristionchus entomophagus]
KGERKSVEARSSKNATTIQDDQISKLQELLEKQQKDNEVLKLTYEHDRIIRECALIKLKEEEETRRKDIHENMMVLEVYIAVYMILVAIILAFGDQMTVRMKISILVIALLVSIFLWVGKDSGSVNEPGRQSSMDIFSNLATQIISDDSALSVPQENEVARKFKPRTVLLTRENGRFEILLKGAFVAHAKEGGPADRAGLLEGDQIVAINDVNVERDSRQEINQTIRRGGDDVKLIVRYNPERHRDITDDKYDWLDL